MRSIGIPYVTKKFERGITYFTGPGIFVFYHRHQLEAFEVPEMVKSLSDEPFGEQLFSEKCDDLTYGSDIKWDEVRTRGLKHDVSLSCGEVRKDNW